MAVCFVDIWRWKRRPYHSRRLVAVCFVDIWRWKRRPYHSRRLMAVCFVDIWRWKRHRIIAVGSKNLRNTMIHLYLHSERVPQHLSKTLPLSKGEYPEGGREYVDPKRNSHLLNCLWLCYLIIFILLITFRPHMCKFCTCDISLQFLLFIYVANVTANIRSVFVE